MSRNGPRQQRVEKPSVRAQQPAAPDDSTSQRAALRVDVRALAPIAPYLDAIEPLAAALAEIDVTFATGDDVQAHDPILFIGEPARWQSFPDRRSIGALAPDASALPDAAVIALACVDAILAPSQWAAGIVRNAAPEHVRVIIAQPGVDTAAFPLVERVRGPVFRLLVDLGHVDAIRGGADLAINAFARAFPDRDDVQLVIDAAAPIEISRPDLRVAFSRERRSAADRARLFASVDALVHVPRCDPDGRTALAAMAAGLPVILADGSALHEIAEHALAVPTRDVPAYGSEAGANARWYEADVDALADAMRSVETDYATALERARAASEYVARTRTWAATAAAIRTALDRIEHPDTSPAALEITA
ncbi:MAG: glycosyl transferase group 1 [Candidatus Eremiobacteraeota bacterium]|nr:glycosyl transferase group 1 [Candidatus Eremiobacteraeota bacterium]